MKERFVLGGRAGKREDTGWWLVFDTAYCYETVVETHDRNYAERIQRLLNDGEWEAVGEALADRERDNQYLRSYRGQWAT